MVVRWVRRAIVVWLLFVAALLVAADFGARVLSQYVVARQLQDSLSLQDRPKVSFGGWPFIAELVGGNIASVRVDAHGAVTDQRFPVQSVDVTLRDVKFSFSELVAGGGQRVHAKSGEGTITMTEADVNSALPAGLGVTVDLEGGEVVLRSDQVKGRVEATVEVSGGHLVLHPEDEAIPSITVVLPDLAQGLRYTDVTVTADRAVVTFELEDASFET